MTTSTAHDQQPQFFEQVDDGRRRFGTVAEDDRLGHLLLGAVEADLGLSTGCGVGRRTSTASFFEASRPFIVG